MEFTAEDHELLRSSLRGLLHSQWPSERVPGLLRRPEHLRAVWRFLSQLGLSALGSRGQGGIREAVLVQEELGRASCPAPLAAAVVANRVLDPSIDSDRAFLSDVHAGNVVLALGLEAGDAGEGDVELNDVGEVAGRRSFVEGVQGATHILFSILPCDESPHRWIGIANLGDELAVKVTPGYSVPSLAEVSFNRCPARLIRLSEAMYEDVVGVTRLLLVSRAFGAAKRGYELVVEHVKGRRQFGVPIGSFQAMQHKLANILTNLEGTRLAIEYAADQFDAQSEASLQCACIAYAFANHALRHCVLETHHAFGAIGFSEEHEMPRHFRRVHGDLARMGGGGVVRQAIAKSLLEGSSLPEFDLGSTANAFREEVQQFLLQHWNQTHRDQQRKIPLQDRGWDPAFSRNLAEKGWTSLAWPQEYGGQARSALEQFAFVEAMAYSDAPTMAHSCAVNLVAPAIIAFGSHEQKRAWLPAIARNEISCCLGYSEPEAGSDLSALRTCAEPDGDDWIINGQKLWTTLGDRASHVWLAVRTDSNAKPKSAGISVFLLPLDRAGISIRPNMAMYGRTFCTVFYDNVRVAGTCMVGGLNNGWQVITHALASERIVMGGRVGTLVGIFDDLVRHLRSARVNGRLLRDDPLACDRIGQLAAELQVARYFVLRNVHLTQNNAAAVCETAMSKVFSGELMERTLETALDLLGTAGTLSEESDAAPLNGRIEQALRTSIMMVIGGGAAEIQRTLIAQRGIGLPRA